MPPITKRGVKRTIRRLCLAQVFELLLQVFKGCFEAAVGTQVIRKTTVFPLQVQHPSRILDDRA